MQFLSHAYAGINYTLIQHHDLKIVSVLRQNTRFSKVMNILDQLRVWILGDPIKVDTTKTLTETFMEYMLDSNVLVCLIIFTVLYVLTNLLLLMSHKRKDRGKYYFYTAGCFLIFTAIVYKYSYEVILNTTKPGNGAVAYGLRKINSALRLVDDNLTEVFDSWLHSSNKNRMFLKSSAFDNLNGVQKVDMNTLQSIHNSTFNTEHRDGSAFNEQNISPQIIATPNTENKIEEDIKQKQNSEESNEVKPAPTINKKNGDAKLKSSNSKTNSAKIEAKTNETSEETDSDEEENSSEIKEGDRKQESVEEKEMGLYMKKVSKILEVERKANTEFKEKTTSYKKTFTRIDKDWEKFQTIFNEWYTEASKIEDEMNSFNAPIRNMRAVENDMEDDIDSILKLRQTFSKLTFNKEDEQLNRLHANYKKKNEESTHKSTSTNSAIVFITVYFLFHVIFACYFVITIICKLDYNFVFRCITYACLALDVFFGIYMLVYAHVLDKICVIGEIEGCKRTFSDGFVDFAAFAGLDLKNTGNAQKEKIYSDINQIQVKAEAVAGELKKYLGESKMLKFHLKAVVFIQTFNKIEFVKDEFELLTNNKVNKKQFFEQIDDMKRLLENLSVVLENQLHSKVLLDTFAREVSFLTFIKTEKDSLYRQVDMQLNSKPNLNVFESEECDVKKKKICHLKFLCDCVSFALFLGGCVFMFLICV